MVLEYICTDTIAPLNAHFCHVLHSVMFSTETKNYHNTPQHNCKHNRAPCPTAPSTHASYKGYGCNNAKPPRPPHRNTMIDAWYSGVVRFGRAREWRHHLLGCIFSAKFGWRGGLLPWPNHDGRTKLDRLSRSKNSTMPQSTFGGLLMFGDRPGDGTAALFVGTEIRGDIQRLGGVEGIGNW